MAVLGALGVLAASFAGALPANATDPCTANPIVCENAKPGADPDEWDIDGAGDDDIQGFSTAISVDVGETVDFKIDTDAAEYTIDVYRTGWYGGLGARHIDSVTPSAALPQVQPECLWDVTTELYDCGNWAVSASWSVPADAVSGVYLALLTRPDNGHSSHVTFVVRDDASTSDVVVQTSDTTWHAYNTYGGSDFYQGAANGRAYKISYNRPFATRGLERGRDFYFSAEYPMVRFLERNGYDVTYVTGADTDRRGELIRNHRVFLSVGHDEYWSHAQRAHVEAARDAGVNLAFFSGNEVYWATRWEGSIDGSGTPHRTLVSYKETWSNAKIDPHEQWTGTWRDPRFASPEHGGGRPENGLTGTIFQSNLTDLPITISAEEGQYRLWRHTSLDSLAPGTSAELAPHTVGYESDEDWDNGARPEGLIRLSTTTGEVTAALLDYGNETGAAHTTHHTTLYRAASGALVFSAGTIQWTWGLDEEHDGDGAPADPRMQQATVNLLADMDAQPATLMPELVQATATTDTTAPVATVTAPEPGTAIANGAMVTVTGTATDTGGRVAAVEVSTDGGERWHPAVGTTSWSYTYVQHGSGAVPVLARAVDDSANIGASAAVDLAVSCPCSLFGAAVPAVPSADDSSAVELGLRFSPTVDGVALGVRFYKGEGNDGMHVGSLWSATGQRLASVTFTDENATGWQVATFAEPVTLAAWTTYVVSYTAPNGHYAAVRDSFWAGGVDAPPLSADGGFGAEPAGVFAAPGAFPTQSYRSSNYFVDVQFVTSTDLPLTVSALAPRDGAVAVATSAWVSAVFSRAVEPDSVGLALVAGEDAVAGTTAYEPATRTVTFTPDGPLAESTTYQATVTATDAAGAPLLAPLSWSFSTVGPDGCPCSLFGDAVPEVASEADSSTVELGVSFTPSVAGRVLGVRFYKGPDNTGTHTGTLWSSGGEALATVTFTGESASGWQSATFDAPVDVAAGTTYVVSYLAPHGGYAATRDFFSTDHVSGPLTARAAVNGLYRYGGGFPTSTYRATNYHVDALFEPVPAPLVLVSRSPAPDAVAVGLTAPVSAEFSRPVAEGVRVEVSTGGSPVAGTTQLSAEGVSVTFTPEQAWAPATTFTVTVSDAQASDGSALGPVSWSFTTVGGDGCPCSLFGDEAPVSASVADTATVELGVAFTPAVAGRVLGVRFYKGPENTGTHTGTLWSADGVALATVTFAAETLGGWQTATFDEPVDVTAGTTYVASYLAPRGGYAATLDHFTADHAAGPLTAPAAGNGRFRYGGGFPTSTYRSANYFVDVLFEPVAAPLMLVSRSPAPGAVAVGLDAPVSAEFSEPVQAGVRLEVAAAGEPVTGTTELSTDRMTVTFIPDEALNPATTYTATVSDATSLDGSALGPVSWTFSTVDADGCPCSLFGDRAPATASVDDPRAVELGVAFTPSSSARVLGVRFFKGAGNAGTHTGTLWSAAGEELATVTFTGESSSGWQTAMFEAPVPVAAGTTYIVSYLAPHGGYAATLGYFTADHTAGLLSAPAAGNGRYRYGGGFPTSTYHSTNYFVDVLVERAP